MSCSSATSKICLTAIGVLFWLAAAALIFLGAWVFHTYSHFNELATANLTLIPAGILIIVGVFLFILGSIGCIAACKENKCLLAAFFSILLIVLTAEVTAAVLGYIFRTQIKKTIDSGVKDAMDKYSSSPSTAKDQIDYLQSLLKCCGINNASDWNSADVWSKTNSGHVPVSCCKVNMSSCNTAISSKEIFSQGCSSLLEQKFQNNLAYATGVAVAFAVIQFIGLTCSCILMLRSNEVKYEILGGLYSGTRM